MYHCYRKINQKIVQSNDSGEVKKSSFCSSTYLVYIGSL